MESPKRVEFTMHRQRTPNVLTRHLQARQLAGPTGMKITRAKIVCSWCGTLMAEQDWPYNEDYGDTTTSHGMCDACSEEASDEEE